jgi:hypothetical protein
MRLPGNDRVICNHRWPIKGLFAAFVGALKLVTGTVVVEKAHTAQPLEEIGVVIFNKPCPANHPICQVVQLTYTKPEKPRAGLAPAACCLRGSRSTGLSYRGAIDANNEKPIFKSSQTPILKALVNSFKTRTDPDEQKQDPDRENFG